MGWPIIQLDLRKQASTIADKIASARFIVFVMLSFTVCRVTDKLADMLLKTVDDPNKFLAVKDIFIYVMGIISGVLGSATALYFTRPDRKSDSDNGHEPQKTKEAV